MRTKITDFPSTGTGSAFERHKAGQVVSARIAALFLILLTALSFCSKNPVDDDGPGVGPEDPIPPTYFNHPAWHPEGTWIAANHGDSLDTDGDGQDDEYFGGIWLIHATTGTTQPLVKGFGTPAWNPDGTQLAMGAGGQIFTIGVISLEPARVDTSSLSQLTDEGANFFPGWSSDGQWIVYDSDIDDTKYDIWIMASDGTNKRNISGESDSVAQGGWRKPNWSPDGKHILHERYLSDANGPQEIAIMDTAGHNPVRLTFNKSEAGDMHPRYSPDGTLIAWYSKPKAGPPSIWVMRNDGSDAKQASPEYTWRFDWSPDGSKLVFLYLDYNTKPLPPGNGELWLVNLDGTGLRQLTHYWNIGG